ncbi:unnamed protein product [Peronospora destructor]|uniref:Reverse transcriptase domain-containing protein n=1 Tax=Peronospora destructor TaxID=86335 RepID=A0AAV0TSK4_9STRA|nr:unnamed protein product [Peronospora destructor]
MTTTLKGDGYADDTALFLSDPCQITRAIQIVNDFGAVSGLLLHLCKTIAIALHPDGLSADINWTWQITLQPASAFVKYLGLQVGSTNGAEHSWHIALDQLKTRVRLASQKTLTIEQRAIVASAVILAKLLYIARHAWPTTRTVRLMEKYIKNYVWHGVFCTLDTRCTTWMTGTLAGLRRKEGGLAVPNLRAELLALAAVT